MLILVSSSVITTGRRTIRLTITGGNPSAEEVEEALESGATQVNNVVNGFRLQQTSFDKKVGLEFVHEAKERYIATLSLVSLQLAPFPRTRLTCSPT